jgi:hypothetical protein
MALRPEVSLPVALATGTVVYTIYNQGLPGQADIRAHGSVGDQTLESVRKQNLWTAAAVVGGISLIAKDATVFIVGGAMVVALDWMTRANNFTNPLTGRIDVNPFTVEKPSAMADVGDAAPVTEGEVNYGEMALVS